LADILIVEDDFDIADALASLLASGGHRPRMARNGVEGLQAVADAVPDLIVLDVEMPILDGPGMVEELDRRRAGQRRIPIVLISAAMKLETIARWLGTPYHVKKPIVPARMLALVNDALRGE
jgi:CheY-like chemotaxis protein